MPGSHPLICPSESGENQSLPQRTAAGSRLNRRTAQLLWPIEQGGQLQSSASNHRSPLAGSAGSSTALAAGRSDGWSSMFSLAAYPTVQKAAMTGSVGAVPGCGLGSTPGSGPACPGAAVRIHQRRASAMRSWSRPQDDAPSGSDPAEGARLAAAVRNSCCWVGVIWRRQVSQSLATSS